MPTPSRPFFLTLFLSAILLSFNGIPINNAAFSATSPILPGTQTGENPSGSAGTKTNPHKKEKGSSSHPSPKDNSFTGTLEKVDLLDHPMTVMAISNPGRPSEFVFGGDLSPRTDVLRNGKNVGVKSLKQGEKVTLRYQKTPRGILVLKIRIH